MYIFFIMYWLINSKLIIIQKLIYYKYYIIYCKYIIYPIMIYREKIVWLDCEHIGFEKRPIFFSTLPPPPPFIPHSQKKESVQLFL